MGKTAKFLFFDCSEAATCCDKAQYKEANLFEKAKLMLHLAFCKTCRKFSARNSRLTHLVKDSKLETCPEEDKKKWREEIKKEFAEERS